MLEVTIRKELKQSQDQRLRIQSSTSLLPDHVTLLTQEWKAQLVQVNMMMEKDGIPMLNQSQLEEEDH